VAVSVSTLASAYFFTAPVFEDSTQLLKPLAKDQATPDRADKILTLLES
jgi:hypothetical protein